MKNSIIAAMCALGFGLLASTALAQGPNPPASAPVTIKEANHALAKSVRKAIGRAKGLDPTRVYVKANGGVITLSGSLRNQAQIDLAGKTAEGVDGVTSVSNRITIFNEGGN